MLVALKETLMSGVSLSCVEPWGDCGDETCFLSIFLSWKALFWCSWRWDEVLFVNLIANIKNEELSVVVARCKVLITNCKVLVACCN